MTKKRRSMSGMGKGIDAFFEEPDRAEEPKHQQATKAVSPYADIQTKQQAAAVLERATFYIRPSQHTTLEELKISLRKRRFKTNKSELLRTAIDLLAEQDLQVLIDRLTNK